MPAEYDNHRSPVDRDRFLAVEKCRQLIEIPEWLKKAHEVLGRAQEA